MYGSVEATVAQVTIYLDDDTMVRLREAARAAGVSMSAWLAGLVREKTTDAWPPSVAALAGAWPDLPDPESLRDADAT